MKVYSVVFPAAPSLAPVTHLIMAQFFNENDAETYLRQMRELSARVGQTFNYEIISRDSPQSEWVYTQA